MNNFNPEFALDKIGIGIITCDRPDYLNVLTESLRGSGFSHAIIVNDGSSDFDVPVAYEWVDTEPSYSGVAKAKNLAMKHLLDEGCEYIFILEDDMKILDPRIFERYIEVYKNTGIHHMMFAYHGCANMNNQYQPSPRYTYPELGMSINRHSIGALCFYTRECLLGTGLYDERYYNACEHVDHSYEIYKQGYGLPFWNWPDIIDSYKYIEEQERPENSNSSIRKDPNFMTNVHNSDRVFISKHGCVPMQIEDTCKTDLDCIIDNLKFKRTVKVDKPIYMFYHLYEADSSSWNKIDSLIKYIEKIGLLDHIETVYIGVNRPLEKSEWCCLKDLPDNVEIFNFVENITSEYNTLKMLKDRCDNKDCYVLYMHSKGNVNPNSASNKFTKDWVRYMEYCNLTNFTLCLRGLILDGVDTVGTELTSFEGGHFYAGNFWWANSDYIKTLDFRLDDDRYYYERWLLNTGNIDKNTISAHTLCDIGIRVVNSIAEINKEMYINNLAPKTITI